MRVLFRKKILPARRLTDELLGGDEFLAKIYTTVSVRLIAKNRGARPTLYNRVSFRYWAGELDAYRLLGGVIARKQVNQSSPCQDRRDKN